MKSAEKRNGARKMKSIAEALCGQPAGMKRNRVIVLLRNMGGSIAGQRHVDLGRGFETLPAAKAIDIKPRSP
jgi:hypothetical protein